jgi:Mg2+ and Co2+ transporter CorA
MPLTLMSGMWGMNVELPELPGGPAAQFWWVSGFMLAVVVVMLVVFRRRHWM